MPHTILLKHLLSESTQSFLELHKDSKKTINSLVQFFPALPAIIFETSLNHIDFIDFSVPFINSQDGGSFFSHNSHLRFIPNEILYSEQWSGILNFSEAINLKKEEYRHQLIWLEFDVKKLDNRIPVPGIFFDFPSPRRPQLVFEAIEKLTEKDLSKAVSRNLEIVLSSIAFSTSDGDIGVFLNRRNSSIRISVLLSLQNIFFSLNFLNIELHYEILKIITKIENTIQAIRLNIDVNDESILVQSIEIYPCSSETIEMKFHIWENLFKTLTKNGWSDGKLAQIMLKWPNQPEAIMPTAFKMVPPNNFTLPDFIFRKINHLKILVRGHEKMTKIYLKESYCWL